MRNVHRFLTRLLLLAPTIALLLSSKAEAAALYYLYDSSGNRIATIDPATVQTTIGTNKIADGAVTASKVDTTSLGTIKAWGNFVINAGGSVTFSSSLGVASATWNGGTTVTVTLKSGVFSSATSYVVTTVNLAGGNVDWSVSQVSATQFHILCSVNMGAGTRLGFMAVGM